MITCILAGCNYIYISTGMGWEGSAGVRHDILIFPYLPPAITTTCIVQVSFYCPHLSRPMEKRNHHPGNWLNHEIRLAAEEFSGAWVRLNTVVYLWLLCQIILALLGTLPLYAISLHWQVLIALMISLYLKWALLLSLWLSDRLSGNHQFLFWRKSMVHFLVLVAPYCGSS